jgi:hypothetical protein
MYLILHHKCVSPTIFIVIVSYSNSIFSKRVKFERTNSYKNPCSKVKETITAGDRGKLSYYHKDRVIELRLIGFAG